MLRQWRTGRMDGKKVVLALATLCAVTLVVPLFSSLKTAPADGSHGNRITLAPIGTFATGTPNVSAAEIVAHDPATQRLFVVNAQAASVQVLDISNPATPVFLFAIDVTPFGAVANSVAVHDDVVAVAVEKDPTTDPGVVAFFTTDGLPLSSVAVGALPDMLTFTPNGRWVLVANEGFPNSDYTVDPEGSVSIIDMSEEAANVTQADVCTAGFGAFNEPAVLDPRIRIFGPGATVAQDLEPESITVSHNSKQAWVTLQENNALGIIDIDDCVVTELVALGFKDHSIAGNGLDASDRPAPPATPVINIATWPVSGMYMPDAIASYRLGRATYLVTANEGDSRDFPPVFSEEARVGGLTLDPAVFPDAATLQNNLNLGRLTVTNVDGDAGNDGDFDQLFAFGARSFSIWSAGGDLVFDSGDDFEVITAAEDPSHFNNTVVVDDRSDNKGPEPEGVVIGKVAGRVYAFIGLERTGGVMVYDITHPNDPSFVEYMTTRTSGDISPEGLIFIKEEDSPNGIPLLVVAYEVSGTTTIYQVNRTSN